MGIVNMALVMVVMAIAAFTDARERIIPNRLIIPAIGWALILQVARFNLLNIAVAIVLSVLLSILYTVNRKFIGGGDIKLFFFLALIFGPMLRIYLPYFGIYSATLWIFLYLKKKRNKEEQTIPLATTMFLAIITETIVYMV